MSDVPDRSGWVGEALAGRPPIPPFPELTAFERRVLEVMVEAFGQEAAEFGRQIEHCRVVDRIHTGVGFFTRTIIDQGASRRLFVSHKCVHLEVPGTRYGMMITLWGDDGYLTTIEGVTYGDDDLEGQALADLDFVGFQLI